MDTRSWFILLLSCLHRAAAVTHSLKYFHTASSHVPNFPEFVAVGMIDDVPIIHYDSSTRKAEPKQDWMSQVAADDPRYWETETGIMLSQQQAFKDNIEIAKQRFNHTGGAHVFQMMYGCEWDDETNWINGFHQVGYDGEDFIAFDLKSESWIAPRPQAVVSKLKFNRDKELSSQMKNYLSEICPDWLKKYVNYGRMSLLRTVPPSVSLLHTSPSSSVCCYATGFYPNRADVFWRKDGEQLHEPVAHGEMLPNQDGTFQMRVDLNLSSVRAEDWSRYDCVFQLSGLEDVVTRLDQAGIRTNEASSISAMPLVCFSTAALLVVGICVGLFVFVGRKIVSKTSVVSSDATKKMQTTENPTRSSADSDTSHTLLLRVGKTEPLYKSKEAGIDMAMQGADGQRET